MRMRPLVKEVHQGVLEVKPDGDLEIQYITLFRQDIENPQQG